MSVDFENRRCVPCEGGIETISMQSAQQTMQQFPDWKLDEEGKTISRKLNCKTFVKAVQRIGQIAEVAEVEQHHPDLHLTGYRHLTIVLTTHAIGGLSENDFIVAAKIDRMLA